MRAALLSEFFCSDTMATCTRSVPVLVLAALLACVCTADFEQHVGARPLRRRSLHKAFHDHLMATTDNDDEVVDDQPGNPASSSRCRPSHRQRRLSVGTVAPPLCECTSGCDSFGNCELPVSTAQNCPWAQDFSSPEWGASFMASCTDAIGRRRLDNWARFGGTLSNPADAQLQQTTWRLPCMGAFLLLLSFQLL